MKKGITNLAIVSLGIIFGSCFVLNKENLKKQERKYIKLLEIKKEEEINRTYILLKSYMNKA